MSGRLALDGCEIDYRWIPGDAARPVLVFLHEGLGSVAMWRDFPDRIAAASGASALVYSREGYGDSSPAAGPFPFRYMHVEAELRLPAVLGALGIVRPILIGHSDGGSIALIYAGAFPEAAGGLVVMAPHIFIEDCTLAAVGAARRAFERTDLRDRLARYHRDPDGAFEAWNGAWLRPEFRAWNIEAYLGAVRAPLLAIQGEGDPYGTPAQVRRTVAQVAGPAELLLLPDCGHVPWREAPAAVADAVIGFVNRAAA